MCHYEHCNGVVTGKPVDEEVQAVNRLAQRGGPILIPLGVTASILGIVVAVLSSVC